MAELLITLLAILVVISIGVTAYLQKKAERELQRKRQIKLHSSNFSRQTIAIAALVASDDSPELAAYLNRYRCHAAAMWRQWDPESASAARAVEQSQQFHHVQQHPAESGMQWASVIRGLREAEALLKELAAQELLSPEALADWQTHLKTLSAQSEADAQIERAEKMEERKDKAVAVREYRSALSRLISSGHQTPGIEARRADLENRIEALTTR